MNAISFSQTERTIRVTGVGQTSAPPDMAIFDAAVSTEAKTAGAAVEANSATAARMIAMIKTQGIADKDVQTSNFTLMPQYGNYGQANEAPKVTGYVANNQIQIRVRDLKQVGKLIDALVTTGGNMISNLRFTLNDDKELSHQARRLAMSDARSKAEIYAEQAGGRVGRVLVVREGVAAEPVPMMPGVRMMAAEASVPVATGEQDVRISVEVTFELVEKE